jgi:hypothetical protein
MTADEAKNLIFEARLLLRGWDGVNFSDPATPELRAAIDRLDAAESLHPQLQGKVDLIRAAYRQRNP